MAYTRQIEKKIAYQSLDDKDIFVLMDLVRNGINYTYFANLADKIPFSMNEWANILHLSSRTLQRYQKEKKSFETIQSERILQISMLYKYGQEVFGDADNFNTWMENKNLALGGVPPKQLLDTNLGIGMLKDELGRIEHGIFA